MSEKESILEERIRGVEQEYRLNTNPPYRNLAELIDETISGLEEKEYITHRASPGTTRNWAPNGGVVYNDLDFLEISTPSYVRPLDSVIYDKVSEIYALAGKDEAENKVDSTFKSRHGYGGTEIFKTNLTKKPRIVSHGTHGNFCLSRESVKDWGEVKDVFVPFNVARILLTGAGDIYDGDFVISPRSMFLNRVSSYHTTGPRGIVNERNRMKEYEVEEDGEEEMVIGWERNYSDPKKWMRFHDINFEALRCDWNVLLRDVFEAFTASAFEKGYLEEVPRIPDPLEEMKKLSRDVQGRWKLSGTGGEEYDAVEDVLSCYSRAARKMVEEEGNELDERLLEEVEMTLEKLNERNLKDFKSYGLDWVTKLDWLRSNDVAHPETEREVSRATSICNGFSKIGSNVLKYAGLEEEDEAGIFKPEKSLKYLDGRLDSVLAKNIKERVSRSLNFGPEETRDFFSSLLLREYPGRIEEKRWDGIKLEEGEVDLSDPKTLNRAEFERMGPFNDFDSLVKSLKEKNLLER